MSSTTVCIKTEINRYKCTYYILMLWTESENFFNAHIPVYLKDDGFLYSCIAIPFWGLIIQTFIR